MNRYFLLMVYFFLLYPALAQQGLKSPSYDKVLINKLGRGYEKPEAYAGVLLKANHISLLKMLIENIQNSSHTVAPNKSAFIGIYLYDELDRVEATILFNENQGYLMYKDSKTEKVVAAEEEMRRIMYDIITETLWIFNPVIPAVADTIYFVVPQNMTWQQIADSFKTTIPLLCEINHWEPEWGINPERNLLIIPGIRELRYPAPPIPQKEIQKLEDGTFVIVHTVKKRESLYSISGTYHFPIEQIMAFNRLSSYALNVGQLIYIPIDTP